MSSTLNGIIMNDSIAERLSCLQQGYAGAIANELDNAIGFILENVDSSDLDAKRLINVLGTLHNARTALLGLIPEKTKGGER